MLMGSSQLANSLPEKEVQHVASLRSRGRWLIVLALLALALPVTLVDTAYPDGGDDHQTAQTTPIELGASGGSVDDSTRRFCCGGTLGALVTDIDGGLYILGNNHVLARFNKAEVGEDIVHPGLIDAGCSTSSPEVVANLTDFVEIFKNGTNDVDAAIAEIVTGTVNTSGSILDIGTISADTLAPSVGLAVKKSSRTTGLTTGSIAAVDVTLDVGYNTKCGGGKTVVARFTGAFRINGSDFSDGGDSGALVVEDVTSSPRAVGLLFAGSSSSTFCNPIDSVLAAFGVSLVGVGGDPPLPPPTGSISGTVTDAADASITIEGAQVSADGGLPATTNEFGVYTILDVPVGTVDVTASAAGFDADTQSVTVEEGLVAPADFSLTAAIGGSLAIVECITYTTSGGKRGDRNLNVAVSVTNDLGDPVEGADVSVELTFPSGGVGSATGVTNADGDARFIARRAPSGCYSLDVTNIIATGLAFDDSELANGFDKGTDDTPDAWCQGDLRIPCNSGAGSGGAVSRLPLAAQSSLQAALHAKRQHQDAIFDRNGVVGVGVGVADGETCIEVYLKNQGHRAAFRSPEGLDDCGVPVRLIVTGPIEGR